MLRKSSAAPSEGYVHEVRGGPGAGLAAGSDREPRVLLIRADRSGELLVTALVQQLSKHSHTLRVGTVTWVLADQCRQPRPKSGRHRRP